MATNTVKHLAQAQIATSAAAIYTVAASTQAIVKELRVVNTDTAASHYFTLYKNGTAATNQITGRITLQPNEVFIDTGPIMLSAAGTIGAIADTASMLTITIGGMEITA